MRAIVAATMVVVAALAITPIARAEQADAQTKQAVETMVAKWLEAVNKGEFKTAESFFTTDGFIIDVYGKSSGDQKGELTKKAYNMGINLTNQVDDVQSLAPGQVLLASGTFTVSYSKNPMMKPGDTVTGNWMRVLVKEGSDWKIAAQSLTRQAPPPAASGTSIK
jgi:ketosteroid isomerase-like protein